MLTVFCRSHSGATCQAGCRRPAKQSHDATMLAPAFGTLVPLRRLKKDRHIKRVSVWASCIAHSLNHSAGPGWALRRAVDFCAMWPEHVAEGHGEGFKHDTAMLLGAQGWSGYDGCAEIVTPYFGTSGTGQLNAVFPVTPQSGAQNPAAQGSAATGYQPASRL